MKASTALLMTIITMKIITTVVTTSIVTTTTVTTLVILTMKRELETMRTALLPLMHFSVLEPDRLPETKLPDPIRD